MFNVAGGVGCREDFAQRRGYSDRSNAAHSTSLRASSLAATGLAGGLKWGSELTIDSAEKPIQ